MRERWEEVFSSLPGPVGYEIADLSITVGEDMAFTHSFNRASAMTMGLPVQARGSSCVRRPLGAGADDVRALQPKGSGDDRV